MTGAASVHTVMKTDEAAHYVHFVLWSYSVACDPSTQPPEYLLGFHTGRPDTHNFFQNAKSPEFVYPGITKDAKTQIEEPDYTSYHQICLLIYLFVF